MSSIITPEKRSYNILSLDLATVMGWALCTDDVITASGTLDLRSKEAPFGKTLLNFYNFIRDFSHVDEFYFEDVYNHGRDGVRAAHVYGAFKGHLELVSYSCNIRLRSIAPVTIKKRFTGNGRADKRDMCAEAHRRGWQGGHPGTSIGHNEADAIALLFAIKERDGEKPPIFKHQHKG